jgi:hypothetical protein
VFLGSALLCSCLGCHVTSERLIVGTYRAEAPCVTITLVLNRDHSFLQTVRTTSGETKQLTGKWTIGQWGQGIKTVDFDSFLDFSKNEHGLQGSGGTGFRPELWPRGILMGPVIVECSESSYKIDYVK